MGRRGAASIGQVVSVLSHNGANASFLKYQKKENSTRFDRTLDESCPGHENRAPCVLSCEVLNVWICWKESDSRSVYVLCSLGSFLDHMAASMKGIISYSVVGNKLKYIEAKAIPTVAC